MLGQAARSRHLPAPARLSSCKTGAESEGRAGPTALHPLQSPPCSAGTQRGAAPTSHPGSPRAPRTTKGFAPSSPLPASMSPSLQPRHVPGAHPTARRASPLTLEVTESHHLAAGGPGEAGEGGHPSTHSPAVTLGKAFGPHVILQIINGPTAPPAGTPGAAPFPNLFIPWVYTNLPGTTLSFFFSHSVSSCIKNKS